MGMKPLSKENGHDRESARCCDLEGTIMVPTSKCTLAPNLSANLCWSHRKSELPRNPAMPSLPQVDRNEQDAVFQLCRTDQWSKICALQERKPWIALTPMTMDNHITTTILHQAITSKGETPLRARCIVGILEKTPQAAAIKNGYGSLPLHVIAQRNTKMDSATKEKLIFELIRAYNGALTTEGGVGKRTPLHIIFTGKH